VKMLVTPCVPFCVSFYGAYAAYRQALADGATAALTSHPLVAGMLAAHAGGCA
jgi:hypothetical protein